MIVRLIYTLLLSLASPLLLFGLYKSKPNKPKFGSRWKEHFGVTPPFINAAENRNIKPIWVHAVSVGESIAATPLIKKMLEQNPQQPIIVTTTTSTGAEQIAKLASAHTMIEHRYMPLDFTFAVKGFLKAIQPSKMLIIETELWPNTVNAVNQAGIPIYVVNARLSEKSFLNYAKVQPLFNQIEKCLTKVLCQFDSDKERFAQLGVSKEKLVTTGSIKFDISISDQTIEQSKALREQLGVDRPVWIAASTHKGEDEQVLAAHAEVLKQHPNALLILVPRHPERFDEVFDLCKSFKFTSTRRTSDETITVGASAAGTSSTEASAIKDLATKTLSTETQVYLGDTMGEMLVLMGAADVCFVGGSLLGDKVGGHNVLEPAALGVPVITGPSYFNFEEITNELLIQGGIIVSTANNLSGHISQMIEYKEIRNTTSQVAIAFSQLNQGSLITTLNAI
ncbi:3-deoxy-D-manno-octulosonic acid transferase [Vibrio cortegadensis]|uniref:3-deoxy-D-manno-octulosonic acid transferase n=1 Tax=Vibrio cortegadensis TaxID=1328770 RepID=UPI0021C49A10|nr:3-deoxy-D-manno-octulosonic acid transferase [Vibrio cortegadensis]MDN3697707.1 3-deoxy-D-manno-octulosonic acid transferase [Vibrio cortegadensis]